MVSFDYGPVQLIVAVVPALEETSGNLLASLTQLTTNDAVNLLDLVLVVKGSDNTVTVLEFDQIPEAYGASGLELLAPGLAGDEDIDLIGNALEQGTTALVLTVEHVWARQLAADLAAVDGEVVATEWVPARAVNEMLSNAAS